MSERYGRHRKHETSFSPLKWRRVGRGFTLLSSLTASAFISPSSVPQEVNTLPQLTTVSNLSDHKPINAGLDTDIDPLPKNPCFDGFDNEFTKFQGEACLNSRAYGRIAFVDFAHNVADSQKTAQEIEKNLPVITQSQINMKVTAVAPSDNARRQFERRTAKHNCINQNDSKNYSSYIADAVMDLDGYDLIVGLSNKVGCHKDPINGKLLKNTKLVGVADTSSEGQGHLIEIFQSGKEAADLSLAIIHENNHSNGLGEAHTIHPHGNALSEISKKKRFRNNINLRDYLHNSDFVAYGDANNIQGSLATSSNANNTVKYRSALNELQIEELKQPYYAVNPQAEPMLVTIADRLSIGANDSTSLVEIKLKNSFMAFDTFSSPSDDYGYYDSLMLERVTHNDMVTGLNLFIVDRRSNDAINLGYIDHEAPHWSFDVGDNLAYEAIDIAFNTNGSVVISHKSES